MYECVGLHNSKLSTFPCCYITRIWNERSVLVVDYDLLMQELIWYTRNYYFVNEILLRVKEVIISSQYQDNNPMNKGKS